MLGQLPSLLQEWEGDQVAMEASETALCPPITQHTDGNGIPRVTNSKRIFLGPDHVGQMIANISQAIWQSSIHPCGLPIYNLSPTKLKILQEYIGGMKLKL